MNPLPSLPGARWLLPLLVVALVGVSGRIGWVNGRDQVQQRWDRATAAAAQAQSEALRLQARAYSAQLDGARQTERALALKIEEIDRVHTENAARQRLRLADADAAVQRLRSAIAARRPAAVPAASGPGPHPASAGRADDPDAEGELFADCAARYRDLAGQADALADQVTGLQSYAASVSAPQPSEAAP